MNLIKYLFNVCFEHEPTKHIAPEIREQHIAPRYLRL